MVQSIVFTGRRVAELRLTPARSPETGEVAIRSLVSLISTGTESTVFARRFDSGTHWDRWVQYPFLPGYSTVGVVEALGAGVTSLRVGERVVCRCPHASGHTLPEVKCAPVPEGVSTEDAAWFALAKIAFVGMLAAKIQLGERVVVIGAGPIGQMVTRWCAAVAAGDVVVVDPTPARLRLAEAGGATAILNGPVGEQQEEIVLALRGERPDVVIDATGNAAVFSDALRACGDFGRVVLLGDPGSPASQRLTPDALTRGLTIIGAHDAHSRRDARRWDHDREIFRLFFRLVLSARFPLDGLLNRRYLPEKAQEAYDFLEDHREGTMGVVFDWAAATTP